ncbi:MAG TPA: hypothetical protein VNA20_12905 [Frankiaceae bacterium]|nr:hypothetical protein [Frankiaceae bacterium]
MRLRSFLVAAVLALTACAGEVADPGAQPTPTPPAATGSGPACPPASRAADDKWPKEVPDIVPRPAGFELDKVDKQTQGNITQVRGYVPMSMQEALLWIVREFPKAGFALDRGDAEATEIDAPFRRTEALRGLLRVFVTPEECRTYWAYAVVRNTNAPYDISYTPPPSSTPLPFG